MSELEMKRNSDDITKRAGLLEESAAFRVSKDEHLVTLQASYAEPTATRTQLFARDGVRAYLYDMGVAKALLIEANDTVRAFRPDFFGDAVTQSHHLWQAHTGGRGLFSYLQHLLVVREFRGKGVGGFLLKRILDEVMAPRVYLAANSLSGDEDRLIGFYERYGFRHVDPGSSLMYWTRGRDAPAENKSSDACAPA